VERLARAMQNVEDELTATTIAYEYAALAAGPRDDSPLTPWDQGYVQAIRDYGSAPSVCPVCKLGWDRHLA